MARYRPRDLVRVGEVPHALHAEVLATSSTSDQLRRGRLQVRAVAGTNRATREIRTREVTAHWRRVD